MRASWSVSRSFYFQALPTVEVYPPEGGSMAQAFVNSKIQPGKVVVFIKPTCPYCRKTQELLSQLPFKQGLLEFVDITAAGNTSEIQDYLQQLTGARTVSLGSPAQRLGGRGEGRLPDAFVCD